MRADDSVFTCYFKGCPGSPHDDYLYSKGKPNYRDKGDGKLAVSQGLNSSSSTLSDGWRSPLYLSSYSPCPSTGRSYLQAD